MTTARVTHQSSPSHLEMTWRMPRDSFGKRKRKKKNNRNSSTSINPNQIEGTSKVQTTRYKSADQVHHRSFVGTRKLSAWQNVLLNEDNFQSRWLGADGKFLHDIRKSLI